MEKLNWASRFQKSTTKQLLPGALAVFLIILSTFSQGCSTTGKAVSNDNLAEGWQILNQDKSKSSHKWTTYSRKKPGSKFKEFKIMGLINVSPDKAIQVLREKAGNSEKYISDKDGFIKVLSNTEDEMLVYSVYNMPFPFKDREMCERFLFFVNKETGVRKISWQEEWQAGPPQNKALVRMPIARGSWEFVPVKPGRSRATYIVHAEPGGKIPAWMVNAAVKKGLPAELKTIEEISTQISE